MNKHIENAIQEYNFEINKRYGYGYIDGYEVNVFDNPLAAGPVFTFSTYLSDEQKQRFVDTLKSYKIKLLVVQKAEFGFAIMIGCVTTKSFERNFKSTMDKIIGLLKEFEAPKADTCPITGQKLDEYNTITIPIQKTPMFIRTANNAIEEINNNIDKVNEEYNNAPNNYFKGFLGILIGGFAGMAVAIIFLNFGRLSAISSFVSIFLGIYLYKKFGGKPNYVMILMSFITTIVMILGTILLTYMSAANNYTESYKGIEALKYCINNDEEFKKSFRTDMILSTAFILMPEITTIFALIRSIKRPKRIQQ